MESLAPGVWLLDTRPKYGTNVYRIDDVLIDTGWRWYGQRIFRQLEPGMLSLVALTHAHPDHQGLAHLICETFNVPLACHEFDVPAMEGRAPMLPDHSPVRGLGDMLAGSPHPVERVLHDGDEIAGFRVVHTPGHTPGHISLFRESDGVLIAGDALARHINLLTGQPELSVPPHFISFDVAQVRDSARKILELQPTLIGFGHGPPLHDVDKLARFVRNLSSSA